MLSLLTGTLLSKDLDRAEVLTPGGVGYELFIPLGTYEALPRAGEQVRLHTSLVVREDTHPALQQLLVQAAARVHGSAGWIARAGQFPSSRQSEFPLSPEAERFYRTGPPVLQRYLPFWAANLVDRMWVALVSILAALIPLSRVVPPLYAFRVRSRVFRWYRDIREIEDAIGRDGADREDLLQRVDRLDAKVERIPMPLAYTSELYDLRQHIRLVRARLRGEAPPPPPAGG